MLRGVVGIVIVIVIGSLKTLSGYEWKFCCAT